MYKQVLFYKKQAINILYTLAFIAIVFCNGGCKKSDEQVVCFDCKAPLVVYTFRLGMDSVKYEYSLGGYVDSMQFYGIKQQGYTETIDTLFNVVIDYNECYAVTDYTQYVYPSDSVFFTKYCIKQ